MILPEKYSWVKIDDPIYSQALNDLLYTNENLNIIGAAGVGKTILLSIIYDLFKEQNKNVVVCTPTGISSFNLQIKGIPSVTLHSFFKLPPSNVYTASMIHIQNSLKDIINEIDIFIIDEIGFCSNTLFDFIHELLLSYRSKQENGIPRMILFGDPLQLETPLNRKDKDISKYFHEVYDDKICYFNSYSFKDYGYRTIILNKIFRQNDTIYQNIFNRVREGTQTNEDLNILNQQVISEEEYFEKNEMYLYLSTTNRGADLVNQSYYEILPSRPRLYQANIRGKIDLSTKKYIKEKLFLKKDCQIMCIFNSPTGDYVNGTLAKVIDLHNDSVEAVTEYGKTFHVMRHDIKEYEYDYNSVTKQIRLTECGNINIIGCILGFSLTYHKTQSLTLDKYFIDLSGGMFCNAQLYTAISRAKDFTFVGLSNPIKNKDIMVSKEALNFLSHI